VLAAIVLLLARTAFRELLAPTEERPPSTPDAEVGDAESDALAHEYASGRV
jgi:hypothetical protein